MTVLPIRLKNNNPPEPPVIEGRTVSGDTVKLRLPGYGVDPDGDPVTILGLDSAPALGRVIRIGANSIEYTAYPIGVGTDEFTYRITDSLGATSIGTARVSIAPPGPPQPPLAVADSITVAPGRTGRGRRARQRPGRRRQPGHASAWSTRPPASGCGPPTGPIEVDAPDRVDGRSVEVVYRLTDGLDSTQTTLTLRTEAGYNNPPVVSDAFGAAGDGRSVTADVLSAGPVVDGATSGSTSGAYDPDGPVRGPRGRRRLRSARTSPRGSRAVASPSSVPSSPWSCPFRVEDADGGAATGSLYVPSANSGLPFVEPDALIRLKPGQQREVDLADYVSNPSGGPISFTLKSRMWASPRTKLSAAVVDEGSFRRLRRPGRTPAPARWSSRSPPASRSTTPTASRRSCRCRCRSARRGPSCAAPRTPSRWRRPSRC